MIKRLTVAVAALFVLATQAFAAGTLPGFSLSPQFDLTGKVAPGCFLYVIQAGTVATPQQPYQDSGLTILAANPLRCDASGRLPQWFVADGTIKVRLTKGDGTQIFIGDGLLVVGASSGGGGGSPVDPTTVLATGDIKAVFSTGVLTGFVRMNSRTIGSASSGASERANADCLALFTFLWNAGAGLTVSGGKGASAAADWAANKTITTPDARGRSVAGLDDMGSSAAGVITTTTCAFPTSLGFGCGTETKTVLQANIPSYTLPNSLNLINTLGISSSLGLNDPGHTHLQQNASAKTGLFSGPGGAGWSNPNVDTATSPSTTGITLTGGVSLSGSLLLGGTVTSGGSGTALGILPPVFLVTLYMKL